MNVVIVLALLIAGGIIGFFSNRLLSSSSKEQRKLAEQANKSEAKLEQYKLDVADHLASSAKLLEQMNSTCQIAMKQMQESTQLLQQATNVEVEGMPFFSAETEQQLAQTANLRHPKRIDEPEEVITEAPLDYSDNPSGLFADETQSVTTAR
jgi:uncharacterized membrane-anchored protein YhcB (DUF1043 family)